LFVTTRPIPGNFVSLILMTAGVDSTCRKIIGTSTLFATTRPITGNFIS